MVRVAINGFGRIGKQFFLAAMERGVQWEFIINHNADLDFIVYSLKYDSVHPSPKEKIWHDGKQLHFGTKKIRVFHETDPSKLPWKRERVDVVVECTGLFTDRREAEKHLKAGAKRVLISAPAHDNDCTIVCGVNEDVLKKHHTIVSAGSCTTNCVSPMVKILDDAYGISQASFVTTHAYTSTQKLIDGHEGKELRRGRAAAIDIVPSTSGASQSVIESIPALKGKLTGYALRVPVPDGSISSVFAVVKKVPSIKEVNSLFKSKAGGKYKDIVSYTEDPIVSSDIIHDPHSCVFDATLTSVVGNLVGIAGWYDNEWGYSNRLVDVVQLMV